nr:alkaline phosphatase-like [Halyomorpha halys]
MADVVTLACLVNIHLLAWKKKWGKFFVPLLSLEKAFDLVVPFLEVKNDRDYWYELGRAAVTKRAEGTDPRLKAKNMVLLIADGLGVTTNTAARVFKGQRLGNTGEEAVLLWDDFPAVALTKVKQTLSKLLIREAICEGPLTCFAGDTAALNSYIGLRQASMTPPLYFEQ